MVETSRVAIKYSKPQNDTKQNPPTKIRYKWDIYWPNVAALATLHLMAIYGFSLRWQTTWGTDWLTKIFSVLSSFGITAGAHRLWCHKSYKANTLCQLILMFMVSTTYQNSVYIWCRDHRMHHKYSETDADPHNAKRGFFFSHMGWLMVRKHRDVKAKKDTIDLSDLEANPIVMFQHKYYYAVVFVCGVLVTTFVPWLFWGESLKNGFFRATICRYVITVNLTWCINSVAHLYGNKPYDKIIGPTESTRLQYFSVGESFHNYHHSFPWDYKAAEFGNDSRNSTTMLIDIFARLGMVHDRRTVSREHVKKRIERTGDGGYNTNRTVFLKLLPETLDGLLKNVFNILVFVSFCYII